MLKHHSEQKEEEIALSLSLSLSVIPSSSIGETAGSKATCLRTNPLSSCHPPHSRQPHEVDKGNKLEKPKASCAALPTSLCSILPLSREEQEDKISRSERKNLLLHFFSFPLSHTPHPPKHPSKKKIYQEKGDRTLQVVGNREKRSVEVTVKKT
ncbi:hypothetical protein T440DRAFT_216081 [Plenodomus tracheiphilus IPT5]|uniref:Uncharacterized protein n=1 Tax=Plenodomus tracheiphilus IPT5 TaxID=1408161 RepID=A0A6A7AVD1_9PLEO|nr:hypothetical protein T440DRAFT_216081 [Plenodomus tracheiphilus IPT5]